MGCSLSSITNKKKKKDQIFVDSSQQQLSEEQIEQLLKIRFNRSEIIDWYGVFLEKCGTNSNNKSSYLTAHIHKSLFIDYFNQLHPNGDVTRLTESFFRIYDINSDGIIDFMEFMHAISIIRRGDLTEKLSFIFSLLDSNQEGYIDRLKLVKMMEALYNIKGINYKDSYNVLLKKVDNLITRLDNDKERGRIIRYKFIESCMNDPILKDLLNTYK
ncbi:unnamed protein product [Rotaria sp. Silwood1]|nr:unnamed protein product [Rotaria sp. Silwood1]CAF3625079.1 unnamed protein product [Rotaria sp. Silwood1]CAF3692646.1 unnamed protein product [Rotaria sp. Silwood1]CAF4570351.1 unnamed protein product [Rotaria sp. Silwood1]CAF4595499.1 unnamed protein product [Rotaria sp. Silwood1]